MWEGEPVRLDPKRPFVGFFLVAVLCVVLMALSVGRGWSGVGLFHPGKPISAPATGERVDSAPSPTPPRVEPTGASIPAELSTRPLGVSVAKGTTKAASQPGAASGSSSGSPASKHTRAGKGDDEDEQAEDEQAQHEDEQAEHEDEQAEHEDEQAQREDERAQRKDERAQRKADRRDESREVTRERTDERTDGRETDRSHREVEREDERESDHSEHQDARASDRSEREGRADVRQALDPPHRSRV